MGRPWYANGREADGITDGALSSYYVSPVNLFFVYWMGKSFAFKLVKRKNDRSGHLPSLIVAWTAKDCLAQRFRNFVIDTNPGLAIPAWGFAKSKKFVFRLIGPPAHKRT